MYSIDKLIKYVKNFRINVNKKEKEKGGASISTLKKIYVFADKYLTWILRHYYFYYNLFYQFN